MNQLEDRSPTADGAAILDESARLRALEALEILDTEPEERFDRITRLAQRVFGVPMAAVTLLDEDRQWLKSRQGMAMTETPRSSAFCDTAIRQPETFVVHDARADARFQRNPLVEGEPHVRFYAGHPLQAPGGQPVGTLCILDDRPRDFTDEERELLRDLAAWVQKELLLREELRRAAEVQRGLLPRRAPVLDGYAVAGACVPSRAVGGDLFDWYPLPCGLGITVADVMGKGIPAAIMMATVRATLRAAARRDDSSAALAEAAAVLEPDLEETATLVTAFHGRLDTTDGHLRYADAGHGLTLVVGADGGVQRPASGDLPLGALPGERWAEHCVTLEPGDTFVCFSDGLLDLLGGDLDALGRVATLVRASADPNELVDRVVRLTRRTESLDDVTIVAIRRHAR